MRLYTRTALFITAALACSSASAQVVFQDDFNAENAGSGVLNYFGFANWSITGGSVDLIGNGSWDFFPGNGLYVDLDGSTGQAGKMAATLLLSPGDYQLEFKLGGSTRGDVNQVNVALGGLVDVDYSVASADPLSVRTIDFNVPVGGSMELAFQNAGGDNRGAILDDVKLTSIPAPGGMALFAAVGLASRRRRRA